MHRKSSSATPQKQNPVFGYKMHSKLLPFKHIFVQLLFLCMGYLWALMMLFTDGGAAIIHCWCSSQNFRYRTGEKNGADTWVDTLLKEEHCPYFMDYTISFTKDIAYKNAHDIILLNKAENCTIPKNVVVFNNEIIFLQFWGIKFSWVKHLLGAICYLFSLQCEIPSNLWYKSHLTRQ